MVREAPTWPSATRCRSATAAARHPPYYADIDNFVGYPEIVAADRHLDLVNASCPGETTASFIDVNAPSVLCNNVGGVRPGYRDVPYPLHVQYADREQSQLQFALTALAAHDVRLITIQLGANDGFLCIADPTNRCDTTAEQLALAEQVRQRLNLILSTLRGAGGYQGQIVVVTYYATNYADPASTAATLILNSGITRAALANRATVASGFLAFAPVAWLRGGGDSQEAGLLYPGDVHPSPAGQCLLARAVEFVAHV